MRLTETSLFGSIIWDGCGFGSSPEEGVENLSTRSMAGNGLIIAGRALITAIHKDNRFSVLSENKRNGIRPGFSCLVACAGLSPLAQLSQAHHG